MNIKDYILWLMSLPDTTFIESSIFSNDADPHHKQVNSYFSYREIEIQHKAVGEMNKEIPILELNPDYKTEEEPHLVDEILSGKIEAFEQA